jgi:hypothetical protein
LIVTYYSYRFVDDNTIVINHFHDSTVINMTVSDM